MTNKSPVVSIQVRRIVKPRQTVLVKIVPKLIAPEFQERPDHTISSDRMNAP
jgi:hypothetical protein